MSESTSSEFIQRWQASAGAERANYQLFLSELCDLLAVPRPDPTGTAADDYVFERAVTIPSPDGTTRHGRIDLYKRGCFVCETKQGTEARRNEARPEADLLPAATTTRRGHGIRGTKAWDDAMIAARGQAEQYVRALPDDNPPFIVVMDVGYSIELYADFSRLGKVYTPFPDAQNHRIKLDQLADEAIRDRLKALWLDPLSLDPSRRSAKVTREIADKLAKLAKSLEAQKHDPEHVAHFLMRCLFTLFAEDVKLIKDNAFTKLLGELKGHAQNFKHTLPHIWREMNTGTEFNPLLKQKLLHFNGGLFEETDALDLNEQQLDILIDAAKADWKDVEPAIFGTLLERALSPTERHKLGAHYTPRAYVERLVLPTIIEPLRDDWDAARAASLARANAGDTKAAVAEARAFLDKLCDTVVLDPACGTGNFLYVAMHRMKALEGEVRDWLRQLGEVQSEFEIRGQTVDPHQFRGIEINPRAAAIADLVLWIGYLQWHFQTYGNTNPPEPVLKAFHNIENRDAVLAYDAKELVTDESGKPVTRWDGVTMKKSPVTGEDVPDETARTPVYRYVNPRKAEWPKAEFVVGNPPFIGNFKMLDALGEGYSRTIRKTYSELPESIDFVMYWWHQAAALLPSGVTRRFGFIATNSLRQSYNRKVLQPHLENGVSIAFAIPDHPWIDSVDGAAVRISMTVATIRNPSGLLLKVTREMDGDESTEVDFSERLGLIQADLTIGAAVVSTLGLQANEGISCPGVKLHGSGFILRSKDLPTLVGDSPVRPEVVRVYKNGKDLTQNDRQAFVIDFFGYTADEARLKYPELYQHVLQHVKPEREGASGRTKDSIQYAEKWWLFGKPRAELRAALKGLPRYIATTETAKHRFFVFLDKEVLPDNAIIAIALDSGLHLGVLSSRVHIIWALAAGGRLGVGNDPRYNKTRCFDPFPFPIEQANAGRIRDLAEQLDAHRKRQQALHPKLTITDMYNVLEKLRAGAELSAKDKVIHEQGLVSVLKQIHDDLDAAVFAAYGWPADLSDEQILEKLVALNHERAEEEKRGLVRWLRQEFQNRSAAATQLDLIDETTAKPKKAKPAKKAKAAKAAKLAWPKSLAEQAKAVRGVLAAATTAVGPADVARAFKRANADTVGELLDTLVSLGQARRDGDKYRP